MMILMVMGMSGDDAVAGVAIFRCGSEELTDDKGGYWAVKTKESGQNIEIKKLDSFSVINNLSVTYTLAYKDQVDEDCVCERGRVSGEVR